MGQDFSSPHIQPVWITSFDREGCGQQLKKGMPVRYREVHLDCGYRLDLVVEEEVVVELKSAERLERIHEAQLLSYLRLSGRRVGLLINFNVTRLRDGIRRLVNNY